METDHCYTERDPRLKNREVSRFKFRSKADIEALKIEEEGLDMVEYVETQRDAVKSKETGGIDEDEGLCIICFSMPSTCVFLNCGHGGVCLECAMDSMKKNNVCILCRETVVQIIEISENEIRDGLFQVLNSYYVSREEFKEQSTEAPPAESVDIT